MCEIFDSEYRIGINAAKKEMFGPAMFFLRSSAEKGNCDSQNDLGVCYEKQHQYEKAMFWYKVAAINGCEMALCNIMMKLLSTIKWLLKGNSAMHIT